MNVSRALSALLLLLACTRSTELLPPVDATVDQPIDARLAIDEAIDFPESANADSSGDSVPRRRYNFCPTAIDIYGGSNFLLPGCGGPTEFSGNLAAGLYGSDATGFDRTLAGRLTDRLVGDPDLADQFGSQWKVRSCAGASQTLSLLTPSLAEDGCGYESPATDRSYQAACTSGPAPVLLLAASMLDDGCHGGGSNPTLADDEVSYDRHFHERLQTFLKARSPAVALVGTRTEWTDAQSGFMPGMGGGGCWWQRPAWDSRALASWNPSSVDGVETVLVGERQEEFKRHHRCCRELDLHCATIWFVPNDRGLGAVNCDGAQVIVDTWYKALKDWLMANDFNCPS